MIFYRYIYDKIHSMSGLLRLLFKGYRRYLDSFKEGAPWSKGIRRYKYTHVYKS